MNRFDAREIVILEPGRIEIVIPKMARLDVWTLDGGVEEAYTQVGTAHVALRYDRRLGVRWGECDNVTYYSAVK